MLVLTDAVGFHKICDNHDVRCNIYKEAPSFFYFIVTLNIPSAHLISFN